MNRKLGNCIPDGAYEAMVGAIRSGSTPNLFLLQYSLPFVTTNLVLQYVANGVIETKRAVMDYWASSAAVSPIPTAEGRGWLTVALGLIDRVGRTEFDLADVYSYEPLLAQLFPENKNIRPKLRQQLQLLRDLGQIAFRGNGKYIRLGLDKFN